MEEERKIIVIHQTLRPDFWSEWNKVCSDLNKYFNSQKEIREKRLKKKRPRYKDSHSVIY